MRAVIQRVSSASVTILNQPVKAIENGFLILLGIEATDNFADIDWLCNKIVNLRICNDAFGNMNINILDANGSILLVSQFTLYASIKKGNRPSFLQAAKSEIAIPIYEAFINNLQQKLGKSILTGTFGADMQVALVNNGPVTIVIDTKNII